MTDVETSHFADTLITRTRELGHPLCGGLDPHLDLIPPLFRKGAMDPRDPATALAVEAFVLAALERLSAKLAIVKPQIAFFERLGSSGIAVLERLAAKARELGLLVLLDAKRGDIGSTANAYAAAYLEPGAPCEVDAITLNAYLGLDTLEPFASRAREHGRGMFVLVKTSNKGSGDLQDLAAQDLTTKLAPVYEAVASSLSELTMGLAGPATGWSSLGVVVGATYPEQGERVRELMPRALFLIPGYGAQGGSAEDAVRGLVPGPNGLEGGIVNSSRGLIFPEAASGATDAPGWERAIDAAIDQAVDALGEAVTR